MTDEELMRAALAEAKLAAALGEVPVGAVVAKDGEIYVYNMHISPYDKGNIFNKEPDRPKRLLMHKKEIRKLHDLQKQDGYALIPLSVYFKNSRVKVEVGLCKGKKTYDKRDAVAKRDAKREMERAMREKNRG